MNIKNIYNLLYNIINNFNARIDSQIFKPCFVQQAGIGDLFIWLPELNLVGLYLNLEINFYVNDNYLKLINESDHSFVKLIPISQFDQANKCFFNLSPHVIRGGVPSYTFLLALLYFSRAIGRRLNIYIHNEYWIKNIYISRIFRDEKFIKLMFSQTVSKIIIAPNTSSIEKNLNKQDIKEVCRFFSRNAKDVKYILIDNTEFLYCDRMSRIWYDHIDEYGNLEADFFLCADSALLHYFYKLRKKVILVSKDNQYRTFTPVTPIIKMKLLQNNTD